MSKAIDTIERILKENEALTAELETLRARSTATDIAAEHAAKAKRGAPMTPAEIAAAKILAAWSEWPGTDDAAQFAGNLTDIERLLFRIAGCLEVSDLVRHDSDMPTDEGYALLLRARAQGHLP